VKKSLLYGLLLIIVLIVVCRITPWAIPLFIAVVGRLRV
jgi:hypothetical protein